MLLETTSDNLLLPIIDTYYTFNFDNMFDIDYQLKEELQYFETTATEQKKELKNITLENYKNYTYLINEKKFNKLNKMYKNNIEIIEINYKQFESDIIELLETEFIYNFIDVLNNNFDNIVLNNETIKELNKPKEYNFKTDRTLTDIELSDDKINLLFDYFEKNILNLDIFEKFLKDNYTSYDGFMSFVENKPYEFFGRAKEINTIEFDLMIGFIYHYINDIKENNYKNFSDVIENNRWQLIELVNNELYFHKYIKYIKNIYYTENELLQIAKENEALKLQQVLF